MDPFNGTKPTFGSVITPNLWWFAWRPVWCFDGRLAWLRWVYRRRALVHDYLDNRGPDQWWQYAIPHTPQPPLRAGG